jgi:hypothetical protein
MITSADLKYRFNTGKNRVCFGILSTVQSPGLEGSNISVQPSELSLLKYFRRVQSR